MSRASAILLGLGLMIAAHSVRSDVYTFVDGDGVAHYTNVPADPRFRFLLAGPREKTRSGNAYDGRLLAAAGRFDPLIESVAQSIAIAPDLIRAVIAVESGFDTRAVSKAGAAGLMQLMPGTAR